MIGVSLERTPVGDANSSESLSDVPASTKKPGRELLEREVAARAEHKSMESVRTTCSFARAERLLGGEYHGRFLIELLQNAADAWRNDPRAERARSRVAVVVTQGPALIVANQGIALTPRVVIESLGHIGASTKPEGEAIGHKGIGFKSVLEMTSRPEVYSGLQEDEPTLAVRFDPNEALARIKAVSDSWEEFVADAQGLDINDPLAPIPILRYPLWVDSLPEEIQRLADAGFDTAIRLPFDPAFARRRGLTEEDWINEVRRALNDDLSDPILLLLGTFSEVVVDDQLDDIGPTTIRPLASDDRVPDVAGAAGELVRIERTGAAATHWRIYRQAIAGEKDLAGEIAIGLRYEPTGTATTFVPAVDDATSAPFHLFFPTKIPSGLPFLLHGYFQVDASRKGFHGAAQQANDRILTELATLVRDVVRQTAIDDSIDASSLVNLVAACPEPVDALAKSFRDRALTLLDAEDWIPAQSDGEGGQMARPNAFFADSPRLTRLVADVFSPSYVRQRAHLELPHPDLADAAVDFVKLRQNSVRDPWDALGDLCRPDTIDVWTDEIAGDRFRRFITLVNWLSGEFPDKTDRFLGELRGDPASRLVPVVSQSGGLRLLPLPDPSEGLAGQRSRLVMARIRSSGEGTLVPPPDLEVAFLPEALLTNEQEIAQARQLGIRAFTVDNVLDRLNGVGEAPENAAEILTFLWKFLARERRNQYGTKKLAERATVFDPAEWFWCRPGRARESGTRRLEQQRERYLSGVLLPTRNGSWRPAGDLAFGADWAVWLEAHSDGLPPAAVKGRAQTYRALEAVCPDPGERLLAPPEEVLGRFEEVDIRISAAAEPDEERDAEGNEIEVEEELDDIAWDHERHAFLLRLGVWEVLPVEAFEGRDRRDGRAKLPWDGPTAERQIEISTHQGSWTFGLDGWKGGQHWNVYLAEDYQLQWPLGSAAQQDAASVAGLLTAGASLYASRLNATFFCPGCSDSGTSHSAPRQSNNADDYPSWLALELRNEPWVPVGIAGEPTKEPAQPSNAWWLERVPAGQGLMTSPWRFVPVCAPSTGVSDDLRRMAGITTIEDVGAPQLSALLHDVRGRLDRGEIELAKSTDRRSVVSLHSMLYERLADLPADAGKAAMGETDVLCTLGSTLSFESVADARHDDGTYSSYVRYFVSSVPLTVVPRDQVRTARALGISKLEINLRRDGDGDDDGIDVTDELTGMLAERMPQLLAILVHHSLGAQTLTLDSDAFRQRAQRLKRLAIRKVDDLVIHASVEGVDEPEKLGSGQSGDIFLEPATASRTAVLYHDFDGDGWQDRLRRKIAPHLASVLDANPYAHTFALFLQAEGDGEREEFLLELGISDEDVDAVAGQLGVVSEAERSSNERWYTALLRVLGEPKPPEQFNHDSLNAALTKAGASSQAAQLMVLAGGGAEVRSDTSPGSVLRTLHDDGRDVRELDAALRELKEDDGLKIYETRRAFNNWKRAHERRVVALRSKLVGPERAKADVRDLVAPPEYALALDVPLASLLVGVAELIAPTDAGVAAQLADDPVGTLTRIGGFSSPEDLNAATLLLYDAEEQRRALSARATRWKEQIRKLAVLIRMTASETRSSVRAHDESVGETLRVDLQKPSDLVGPVEELFASHQILQQRFMDRLDDDVFGAEPNGAEIIGWIRDVGIDDARIAKYENALSVPRNKRAAQLRARAGRLNAAHVTAAAPAGLVVPKSRRLRISEPTEQGSSTPGPIKVAKIKISPTFDQRKRELGDEGEQWALADTVGTFLAMNDSDRAIAVEDIRRLLEYFEPEATKQLLEHASAVAAPRQEDDDDDLVAALEGLLHVSRYSDGFGFDLIGWAPPEPGAPPHAMCLEVKSTSGGRFHLSSNEWCIAGELPSKGAANRYAVLAVHRGKAGEVPVSMVLLVDPVGLKEMGLILLETDGYVAKYTVQ